MIGVRFGHIAGDYHTDDFYQRMLDFGSGRMNSGTCRGGPLDGKNLHHPAPRYQVAIDEHSKKTIPGYYRPSDPLSVVPVAIRFGTYRFADGVWTWQE